MFGLADRFDAWEDHLRTLVGFALEAKANCHPQSPLRSSISLMTKSPVGGIPLPNYLVCGISGQELAGSVGMAAVARNEAASAWVCALHTRDGH